MGRITVQFECALGPSVGFDRTHAEPGTDRACIGTGAARIIIGATQRQEHTQAAAACRRPWTKAHRSALGRRPAKGREGEAERLGRFKEQPAPRARPTDRRSAVQCRWATGLGPEAGGRWPGEPINGSVRSTSVCAAQASRGWDDISCMQRSTDTGEERGGRAVRQSPGRMNGLLCGPPACDLRYFSGGTEHHFLPFIHAQGRHS